MTTTMATKGTQSGARLLHRLAEMAAGVDKHGSEVSFPNYFARTDVHAEYDQLANALLAEQAAIARIHDLASGQKLTAAEARTLFERGVAAVESFFGLSNPTLREFGIRPRKGRYSPHAKLARRGAKKRKHKAHAKAAAATTATATGGAA